MRIRIYNEPKGGAIGGCEVFVAVLAEALARQHEVEIVHYRSQMTREMLSEFADVDLSRVRLCLGPELTSLNGSLWQLRQRYQQEMKQDAQLSGSCDLFISFNHEPPPFCAAPTGILVVLFPFGTAENMVRDKGEGSLAKRTKASIQRLWYSRKIRSRLQRYQIKLSISDFTRRWTRERWGVHSEILYPPVKIDPLVQNIKTNSILSVGRFAVGGHGKKQLEMLAAFGRLSPTGGNKWSYDCVGARGTLPPEQEFFEKARELGLRYAANVSAELGRADLVKLYERAKIFWHATGMDIDEEAEPQLAEHFGISTVEAMAAGCVPVVINKGGQPEIVEHGVSGFLWNTLEELERYTLRLMNDEPLRQRMSAAACARAQCFSREAFIARFYTLAGSVLATEAPVGDVGAAQSVRIAEEAGSITG